MDERALLLDKEWEIMNRVTFNLRSRAEVGLSFLTFTVFGALIIYLIGWRLVSWVTIAVLGVGAVIFILAWLALSWAKARREDTQGASLAVSHVLWWYLLVSEVVFNRARLEGSLEGEKFSQAAYAEVVSWVFVAFLLFVVSLLRPYYLRITFSGRYKWMSLFALACIVSVVYSPRRLFSLAWSVKLSIIVLVLLMWSSGVEELKDIRGLYQATFWGILLSSIPPFAQIFVDPSLAFSKARLSGLFDPTSISEKGGILLLLSLLLYSLQRRKWMIVASLFATTVMILGGGKASIIAAILAGTAFFLLQKRFGSALVLLAVIFIVGSILLFTTPLARYFHNYAQSNQIGKLTGRIDLWKTGLEGVKQSPIWGHGYMSSKFALIDLKNWVLQPGHFHNAFLETLYNNGLIGLLLIVALNLVILKNLLLAIKKKPIREAHLLAVGSLAIYIDLLIDGMFRVPFGGRPDSFFMVFLALVVVSEQLRRMCQENTGIKNLVPQA